MHSFAGQQGAWMAIDATGAVALIAPHNRGDGDAALDAILRHNRHHRRGTPWPIVCRGLHQRLGRARPRGSPLETADGTGLSELSCGDAGGIPSTVPRHQHDDFRDGDAYHHRGWVSLGRHKVISNGRPPHQTAVLGLFPAAPRIVSDRFGILLASAFRMALNWGEAYNWLAASTLVLLISATAVSWLLLKQMASRPS